MWKDECHKCGQKIFNGCPVDRDTNEYIEEMKVDGFELGYNTKLAGHYPNAHDIKCKPICLKCSNEQNRKIDDKNVKKGLRHQSKLLKKVYVCPLCKGYSDDVFTATTKDEMVKHISEKHRPELREYGEDN